MVLAAFLHSHIKASIDWINVDIGVLGKNGNIVLFLIFTIFLQFDLLHCNLYGLAILLIFFKFNEILLHAGHLLLGCIHPFQTLFIQNWCSSSYGILYLFINFF